MLGGKGLRERGERDPKRIEAASGTRGGLVERTNALA